MGGPPQTNWALPLRSGFIKLPWMKDALLFLADVQSILNNFTYANEWYERWHGNHGVRPVIFHLFTRSQCGAQGNSLICEMPVSVMTIRLPSSSRCRSVIGLGKAKQPSAP